MVGTGSTGTGRQAGFALLACLAFFLLAGCGEALSAGGSGRGGAGTEDRGVVSGTGERIEATVGASSEAARTAGLDSETGDPEALFVADRRADGGAGDEANRILAVRFGEHEDYERVVVDLGTGAEPAETASEWVLDCSAGEGVLRVTFPSVEETRVSNGPLGRSLLKSFYVVRAPEEGMFVDFFAREGFRYRVMELSDPARIVVDLRPSGDPLRTRLPARGGDTVLLEPRRGAEIGDPFTVRGYSRNPEATNTVTLTGSTGGVMARRMVQSNDWTVTWGYFETTLDPPSLDRWATVRAGAGSARDGSFEGVEIPVKGSRK